MIAVVTWENAHEFGKLWASHHRLRHNLFVKKEGWNVPSYNGLEYDQFDTPAAVYLIWSDADGVARGVARLIPSVRPYMIGELWPELMPGKPLPQSETVWEATRFGIDDALSPEQKRVVSLEIVLACQEFGLDRGIDQYLVVMPPLIIRRSIGGAGCPYRFEGPALRLGSYKVVAASIPVTATAARAVRDKLGASRSVLNYGNQIGARAA